MTVALIISGKTLEALSFEEARLPAEALSRLVNGGAAGKPRPFKTEPLI